MLLVLSQIHVILFFYYKASITFNRCLNTPDIYLTFDNQIQPNFQNGYYLEFWMKLDVMREYCAEPTQKNYLFSPPHSLYINQGTTDMRYLCSTVENADTSLVSFSQNEWNIFIIEVFITSGQKSKLGVYLNYNFSTPDFYLGTINPEKDLNLKGICFSNQKCVLNGITTNMQWGAAFYKNLRFWDVNTSKNVIQDFHNNL